MAHHARQPSCYFQALVKQVEDIAAARGAGQVVLIVIGVGPMSGVEAQLLRHAYPVASAGTVAENARLEIERRFEGVTDRYGRTTDFRTAIVIMTEAGYGKISLAVLQKPAQES